MHRCSPVRAIDRWSMARAALRRYPGLKAVFIQDEYRHIDATVHALTEIGVDLLFTCVPEGEIDKVYSIEKLPGLRKVNTLTGFVPEHLCERDVMAFGERPVDVGYRARRVPAWLGELGQDKWRIGPRFLEDALDDSPKNPRSLSCRNYSQQQWESHLERGALFRRSTR